MANRQPSRGRGKRPDLNRQALNLVFDCAQQLDSDPALKASLTGELADIEAGSNGHLEELLAVAAEIEDDINALLCDLSLVASTLEVYSIASATGSAKEIDLCETTSVLQKLLPDHSDWESRMHENFKRLWAMKRGLTNH